MSGGLRTIEAPRDDLKQIQKRIATLLQRVLPPEFLFSPVKGRSYIDNAVAHLGSKEVRLLDVQDYFGNCRSESVFKFFSVDLGCSPDVAWLLTELTTREGHLPQGSPCSPILSFYSCQAMWAEISMIAQSAGCRLTVYVDDITVSGPIVRGETIYAIKQVLVRFGHRHHPTKEKRHTNRAAEITGIIVAPSHLSVPHRHYQKLQAARLAARSAQTEEQHLKENARAKSLEYQVQYLSRLNQSSIITPQANKSRLPSP